MSSNNKNNKLKDKIIKKYIPQIVPSPSKHKKLPKFIENFFFPHPHSSHTKHEEYTWYKILWLTGVDYFSTIGYQPAIALGAAAAMGAAAITPFATILLIIVTLLGAVPTYREVAKRSYTGQGSIAMLENLLKGWFGKIFVLALIGFAATDFVITITLSAADAAKHVVENPLFAVFGHSQMTITIVLLFLLAFVFVLGFTEAIGTAIFVAIPYMILNIVIIVKCLLIIANNPNLIMTWLNSPELLKNGHFNFSHIFIQSAILFPALALGLSGFETGVSVMPLITNKNKKINNVSEIPPNERIKSTKKMLITAAIFMAILLFFSSIASTLLVNPELVKTGGDAESRVISYLAHLYLGNTFGTIYDISTISILWFAGASAMAGLLGLIPRYLPRFGMAPRWVEQRRPLVILLFIITLIVTIIFKADVEAQAGAYATGVLVLILSATIAVALAYWREYKKSYKGAGLKSVYFWFVALIFLYTLIENIRERPDGIIISSIFIISILVLSGISRWFRAFEIRVDGHNFDNEESKQIWESIKYKKINLVPLSTPDVYWQEHREAMIRNYYKVDGPFAFLTIKMRDDRSEFIAPLKILVKKHEKNNREFYLIDIQGAVAIANTIAYISEELDPIALYLGLARKNAMEQAFSYLLFGEGEIGIITYKVLVQHWESTIEDDVRPVIFLMSE